MRKFRLFFACLAAACSLLAVNGMAADQGRFSQEDAIGYVKELYDLNRIVYREGEILFDPHAMKWKEPITFSVSGGTDRQQMQAYPIFHRLVSDLPISSNIIPGSYVSESNFSVTFVDSYASAAKDVRVRRFFFPGYASETAIGAVEGLLSNQDESAKPYVARIEVDKDNHIRSAHFLVSIKYGLDKGLSEEEIVKAAILRGLIGGGALEPHRESLLLLPSFVPKTTNESKLWRDQKYLKVLYSPEVDVSQDYQSVSKKIINKLVSE